MSVKAFFDTNVLDYAFVKMNSQKVLLQNSLSMIMALRVNLSSVHRSCRSFMSL